MAIVYPRPLASFFSLLPISSSKFRFARAEEYQLQGSAATISFDLADPLWACDFTIDKDSWKEGRRLLARLNALKGSVQTFECCNPLALYPEADPTGSILGASTVKLHTISADRDAVRFKDLPIGYTVTEGDFWAVDFSSAPVRRGLFHMLETVVADGFGVTPLARVECNLWTGIATEMVVTLKQPSMFAFIKPQTLEIGATRHALVDGSSFTALQKL